MTREYLVDGNIMVNAPKGSKKLIAFRQEMERAYPEFDYDGFEGDTLEIDVGTGALMGSDDIDPHGLISTLTDAASDGTLGIEGFLRYAREESTEEDGMPEENGITITEYIYAEIYDSPLGMTIEYLEEDGCDIDDGEDGFTHGPAKRNAPADEALDETMESVGMAFKNNGIPLTKDALIKIQDAISIVVGQYADEAKEAGCITTDEIKAYVVPDIMEAITDAAGYYGGHVLGEDALDMLEGVIASIYCAHQDAFLSARPLVYGGTDE